MTGRRDRDARLRRVVTDIEVGELGCWWRRGAAQREADRANLGNELARPVEWVLRRRRGRWAVIGLQAELHDCTFRLESA